MKAFVEKFTVHPDFNLEIGTKYESDIAIAVLKETVTFTDYILPICVNSALNSIDDFIGNGQEGTVTAWGISESSRSIDKARESRIPMFSTMRCLLSDVSYFLSQTAYCGGNRDGKGKCKLIFGEISYSIIQKFFRNLYRKRWQWNVC